jgi:hypothetical protein
VQQPPGTGGAPGALVIPQACLDSESRRRVTQAGNNCWRGADNPYTAIVWNGRAPFLARSHAATWTGPSSLALEPPRRLPGMPIPLEPEYEDILA